MVRAYFVRGVGLAAAALDGREGACAGEAEQQEGGNGELHGGGFVVRGGEGGGGVVIYTQRRPEYTGAPSASFRDGVSFTHVTAESEGIMIRTVGNYRTFLHSPCCFP